MPELIEARFLSKRYHSRGVGGHKVLTALNRISLTLKEGENLGLVGESGSGKTTLGKIIAGLLDPDEGTLSLGGQRANSLSRLERARFAQMVFQDPATALNPKLSIETQLREALRSRHYSRQTEQTYMIYTHVLNRGPTGVRSPVDAL